MGNPALTRPQRVLASVSVGSYLLAGVWLFEVLYIFFGLPALRHASGIAIALFVGAALLRASVHVRTLCIALTAVSGILAVLSKNWWAIPRGIESSAIFGAFLSAALLMRKTAEGSSRTAAVRASLEGMGRGQRAGWILLSSHALGAILNVGAIAILSPMVPRKSSASVCTDIAESSVRGVGLAIVWSPFFVATAVASQLVPTVRPWQSMPVALVLTLVGFVVSYLMFSRGLGLRSAWSLLAATRPLVVPVLVTVLAVTGVAALTPLRGLQAIILVIPPLCFALLLVRGRDEAKRAAAGTFGSLGQLSDELIVITTAMTLGSVLSNASVVLGFVPPPVSLDVSSGIIIGAGMALIVAGGYLGLHPMITASILVPLAHGLQWKISDVVVMETVVVAWALSATVSMFTLPVVAGATFFGVPARRLAVGNNLRFVVVYGMCAVLLLTMLNGILEA